MQPIIQFLLSNGYVLAWPLMVLEGPVITMGMAALASRGYFNIGIVIVLGVVADLVSDYVLYTIGAHPWFLKLARFLGVDSRLATYLQSHFNERGDHIIFLAKVLPGLAAPTFIAAGLVHYPIKRFYQRAIPGGLIWTGMLATIGYFFGKYVTSFNKLLTRTGIVFLILLVVIILFQFYFGKKLAERTLKLRGRSTSRPGRD